MITDGDLLLYYYRDGLEPAERAHIGAAISDDPKLAQRLHRLVARLDAAAAMPDVAVPAHVQQRWLTALDAAAGEQRAAPVVRRFPARWLAAAATVAAVTLVVIFQVMQPRPAQIVQGPTQTATKSATSPEEVSAYENGLKFHLASTERQLADLDTATPEERAKLIETIIGQNRTYALAAECAGQPQLARVLRAFAPVLEEAASGGAGASAASVAQLNFELRVMQARLSADGRAPTNIL